MGQEVSDRRRVPDVVLARWCPRVSGVQLGGELTTAQVVCHQRALDGSYAGGCQGLEHDLRRIAVTFRSIAGALTPGRPRDEFARPRFLQPSTMGAFGHLGALVLGDHPWHRREPCAWRPVAKGMLATDHQRVHRLERLDQEPLMRSGTGKPIRRHDDHGLEFAAPRRVTQMVSGRAGSPCPAAAMIAIFMRWPQRPALGLHGLLEQTPLALDGAFGWLMTGRDAGIEGSWPPGSPDVPE